MRVMAGPLMLRPKTDITILILALVVTAKGVTTNSSLGRRPSLADLLITPFLAFDFLPGNQVVIRIAAAAWFHPSPD
jgi:hypothetical protein